MSGFEPRRFHARSLADQSRKISETEAEDEAEAQAAAKAKAAILTLYWPVGISMRTMYTQRKSVLVDAKGMNFRDVFPVAT